MLDNHTKKRFLDLEDTFIYLEPAVKYVFFITKSKASLLLSKKHKTGIKTGIKKARVLIELPSFSKLPRGIRKVMEIL